MEKLLRVSTLAFIVVALVFGYSTQAQDALETEGEHFEFSTGMALSLTGFKTFHSVQMVDENGFEYDTWSLLREPVIIEAADLSESQIVEMMKLKQRVMNKIGAGLAGIPDTELNEQLKDDLRQAKLQVMKESISELSPDVQDKVLSAIGSPLIFGSEHLVLESEPDKTTTRSNIKARVR